MRYNYKLLQTYCKENSITLAKEYIKVNSRTIIEATCLQCNVICNNTFKQFIILGCYCKTHLAKPKRVNKGTGAGGANTTYYGKQFENKTNNQPRLLNSGYLNTNFTHKKLNNYCLSKTFENKTITFTSHAGLKLYMLHKYNIEIFRCPDEAYIIEYNTGKKILKIIEKKEQHVEGSVETKLWSGPSLKREYELVLEHEFEVHYGFCVNDFLKNKLTSIDKKYTILNKIFNEANIMVLFGDDDNYFELFDKWLFNNSL